MMPKETMMAPMPNTGSKRILIIVLVCALVATSILAGYFYLQMSKLKKNSQGLGQEEVQKVVSKVSHLILLPEGETPTISTLTDKDISLLKSQPFFSKAHSGDQLLVYTNAKEAILYSPANNIIVAVAPVTIGSSTEKK